MKRHRILFAATIVLLVVSTFLVVTHQHDNTADDHDCPTCFASHHHQMAAPAVITITDDPFLVETIPFVPDPVFYEHIATALLSSRAPPA